MTASADPPDPPEERLPLTERQEKILDCIRGSVRDRGYPPSLREIAKAVRLVSTSSVSYQLSQLQRKGWLDREQGQPRTARERPSRDQADLPVTPGAASDPVPPAVPVIDPAGVSGPDAAVPVAVGPDAAVPVAVGPDAAVPVAVDPAAAGDLADVVSVPLVGRIAAGQPITAQQDVEDTYLLPRKIVGSDTLFMLKVVGESMVNAGILDGDYVVVRYEERVTNGDIVAALIEGVAGHEATIKSLRQTADGHFWLMPHNPGFTPISDEGAQIMGKVVAVLRGL
jgi:repressor LexA